MYFWAYRQTPPRLQLQLQLLSVYWLIGGVFDLVEGVTGHGLRTRLWMLLSAVGGAPAAILLLSQPWLTRPPILLMGVAAFVVGAIRLGHGRDGTRTWRSVLIGTPYVVLGLIVVVQLFVVIGQPLLLIELFAWAVVAGLLAILASLPWRRRQKPAHAD